MPFFDIEVGQGSEYSDLSPRAKNELLDEMANATFNKPEDVTDLFDELVKKQDKIDELFTELNNASTSTDVLSALGDYQQYVGIDMEDEYAYKLLNQTEAKEIGQLFIDYPCSTTKGVKDQFNNNVVLKLLNNKDWETFEKVINNNYDILQVKFSDNYNKLHRLDQAEFLKSICPAADSKVSSYTSIQDFKTRFTTALGKINVSEENDDDDDNYTSNNSSNYTIVVPKPVVQEENKAVFGDVTKNHWAYNYIMNMYNKKIVNGYEDNTFKPEKLITRSEFVKIIVGAFDLFDLKAEVKFDDVDSKAWYYRYVASGVKSGIITGYSDKLFGSNDGLSREDMAVIIYRVMKLKGIEFDNTTTKSFADDSSISDYAKEAVNALTSENIMNGMVNNMFEPKTKATRAMVSKVVSLILQEEVQ